MFTIRDQTWHQLDLRVGSENEETAKTDCNSYTSEAHLMGTDEGKLEQTQ